MLLSVQFPLADLRNFLPDVPRVARPNWLLPAPGADFVRYFGEVQDRRRGGVGGWMAEEFTCEARRALALDPKTPILRSDASKPLRCAYKRFYSDGRSTAKFEIGFAPKVGFLRFSGHIDIQRMINDIGRCRVAVRDPLAGAQAIKNVSLLSAGKSIARLYLAASTKWSARSKADPKWVVHGTPLILLEYDADASLTALSGTEVVLIHELDPADYDGKAVGPLALTLHSRLTKFDGFGQAIRVVLLGYDGSAAATKARQLRVQLMRLHAEHECLRSVIRALLDPQLKFAPDTPEANELESFIDRTTTNILRLQKGAQRGFDLVTEFAYESIDSFNHAERERLEAALVQLDMSKNANFKTREYIEAFAQRGGTFTLVRGNFVDKQINMRDNYGNVVLAEHMENVTLSVEGNLRKANATDETKQLVEKLTKEIKELANKPGVDANTVHNLGNDVTAVSAEMSAPQPRPKWYEFTLNGMKDAALALGEAAGPIVTIVKQLLPLLTGV